MSISTAEEKEKKLRAILREMGTCAVAFSGGVDSTYLLAVAREELGENAAAISASSVSFPEREKKEANAFCKERGIRRIVFESRELEIPGFRENPKDRCYICKKGIFSNIIKIAEEEGFRWVAEGSNMDDTGDYRPGMRAIEELGVRSPLREAGLYKAEIRELSKKRNLPTWDKPSLACLATRFPYGETIDEKKLAMVGNAEQFLLDLGFRQMRVRMHGMAARIEVLPEDISRAASEEIRSRITGEFRKLGFSYISLDLIGYRSGSMNETILKETEEES